MLKLCFLYSTIYMGLSLLPLGTGVVAAEANKNMDRTYLTEEAQFLLPPLLCNKKTSYLRVCFNETDDECNQWLGSHVKACIGKYRAKMPEKFAGREEITHWATIVGACSGARAEEQLISKNKMTHTTECENYNKQELPALRSRAYLQLRDIDPKLAQKIKGN